jgi:hypothetical protein
LTRTTTRAVTRLLAGAMALGLTATAGPALAQSADPTPSENLAVNLIELLVKQGTISRAAADDLLKQAEQQTIQARANAPLATGAALPPPAPGSVRVPYVPQVVRDEIRDEVKGEVLAEAKTEGWAQPGAIPAWLHDVSISGDVRMRSQYNLYANTNATGLIDYAAFNSGGPTDINPDTNPNGLPFLNSRKDDLNNFYIRARLAFDASFSDNIGGGIRIATGDSNGPVSTSAFLNGGFAKNGIWLDRGYIWFKPTDWSVFTAGRMPNPFQHTDMLYSDDLNFDGVDGSVAQHFFSKDLTFSFLGGAFPLGFQSLSFPANSDIKLPQSQHWLFAGQAAVDWNTSQFDAKTAVAYYDFDNVRGYLSAPCAVYLGARQCSTDFSTPAFMQKGNTLFLIRDIIPNPANPDYAQPQLVGLRFGYALLNFDERFDYRLADDKHLVLIADYVRNMAYDGKDVCRDAPAGLPVTNIIPTALGNTDPCDAAPKGDTKAGFQSGPNAGLVSLMYGDLDPIRFGQWNIAAGYRFIEPDALLDGFDSTDFHLGGTNAKGYTIVSTVGLFRNAYLQARWFSANQVYGPPLAIDVGQIDLHLRF